MAKTAKKKATKARKPAPSPKTPKAPRKAKASKPTAEGPRAVDKSQLAKMVPLSECSDNLRPASELVPGADPRS